MTVMGCEAWDAISGCVQLIVKGEQDKGGVDNGADLKNGGGVPHC